ncbi:MAG: hypothetical protein ACFE0I_20445 [Elainellaceae cyanobacterium]
MTIHPPSLPFAFPDTFEGFVESRGAARLDGEALVLEFQSQDGVVGVLKSGIREVTIPLRDIESVSLYRGWFRTILMVSVRRMSLLADLPHHDRGTLRLRIARSDRPLAEQWDSFLRLTISHRQLMHAEHDFYSPQTDV